MKVREIEGDRERKSKADGERKRERKSNIILACGI